MDRAKTRSLGAIDPRTVAKEYGSFYYDLYKQGGGRPM